MNEYYEILHIGIDDVILNIKNFTFSEKFITMARSSWDKSPGKYDGTLMGVKNISKNGRELKITVFPMKYSWHRYIAKSMIDPNVSISENENIYPLCLVGLSYIKNKNGRKKFVFGIKKSGNIDGGKLECIPQGFCDFKEGSLSSYLHDMLSQELHEELGSDVILRNFKIKALAMDKENFQYALMTEFEIEESEVMKYINKEGSEHEKIVLINDDDLDSLIKYPAKTMIRDSLEIGAMTLASLELHKTL